MKLSKGQSTFWIDHLSRSTTKIRFSLPHSVQNRLRLQTTLKAESNFIFTKRLQYMVPQKARHKYEKNLFDATQQAVKDALLNCLMVCSVEIEEGMKFTS